MENKQFLIVVVLVACFTPGLVQEGSAAAVGEAPAVPQSAAMQEAKIKDARQALEGATSTLQNNLIGALGSLANASAVAGTNVSRAAATMIRGLVTHSFSLAGVVAYMPRLIFLDGPTQFIETLRLIRGNQIRLPNDVDSAIDTLLVFAGQYRDSGIGENFSPLVTFFPNIFAGVGDFLTTLIDSVFSFIAPV